MQGPRGIWSPKLDPLTVLGIHAKNERERRRIALVQIKLEHQRLSNELAYDRVYHQVGKEYFGNRLLVDTRQLKRRISLSNKANALNRVQNSMQVGDRLLLFVSLSNCKKCKTTAYQAIDRVKGNKGLGVDIFFVGATEKHKDEIQRWAKSMSISKLAIKHGNVSLNYDRGTFKRLTKERGVLPLVLRKRGSQLQNEFL